MAFTVTQATMTITTIEHPKATNSFMRFQVGSAEQRIGLKATYGAAGDKPTGYAPMRDLVPVFKLLGFGATLAAAKRMARHRLVP